MLGLLLNSRNFRFLSNSEILNTTVKQIVDIEVKNELIKTGKENKLQMDKMQKQIRNMDMRI